MWTNEQMFAIYILGVVGGWVIAELIIPERKK